MRNASRNEERAIRSRTDWRAGLRWPAVAAVILAALALRLLIYAYVGSNPAKFFTYDSNGYDRRAVALLHHGVFSDDEAPPYRPDLKRTPVYPAALAAVYAVGGHDVGLAVLLQILVGALAAGLTALLAREIGWTRRAAVLAGLIVALDPVSALVANRLLSETLFTALVVAALYALARYRSGGRLGLVALAAALLAAAALTRPIGQFLPLALLPLVAAVSWSAGRWRSSLAAGLLFLAVSLGLTYAWAYRNYRQAGVFTLSTIGDTNLLFYRARAVAAEVRGVTQDEALAQLEDELRQAVATRPLSPAEYQALQRDQATRILVGHPGATARMLAKGAARILADPGYTIVCTHLDTTRVDYQCFPGVSTMNERGAAHSAVARFRRMTIVQQAALLWSAMLLGACYLGVAVGCAALVHRRRWWALTLVAIACGYLLVLAAGGEGNYRFRVPLMPGVALLAGVGLATVAGRVALWRRAPAAALDAFSAGVDEEKS